MTNSRPTKPFPRVCPICRRAVTDPASRFCSERCAQVDLGRWLRGDYAIPVEDDPLPPDESR
ncbi:DNA gyrase inhibitor YacG [Falsiroseomonas sp. E2-1-a20]|uniref:DNA gyrase inhibitor YacG n=1 Tax=Falsiroseomonas sp. E2-1-a20 TaxID=3239300 RepID=UPI003F2DEF4B